jgi:uncharacterized membrane protein
LAAALGRVDWLAIPAGTRAKSVGQWHAIGNVVVVLLFAISWRLRRSNRTAPSTLAFVFGLIGRALALVTSWLGGELVVRLGVGISDETDLNASSSLSGASVAAPMSTPRG